MWYHPTVCFFFFRFAVADAQHTPFDVGPLFRSMNNVCLVSPATMTRSAAASFYVLQFFALCSAPRAISCRSRRCAWNNLIAHVSIHNRNWSIWRWIFFFSDLCWGDQRRFTISSTRYSTETENNTVHTLIAHEGGTRGHTNTRRNRYRFI